ncbi:MAG: hypothetical protein MHMPM18_001795 [Marteilia pararefringens]
MAESYYRASQSLRTLKKIYNWNYHEWGLCVLNSISLLTFASAPFMIYRTVVRNPDWCFWPGSAGVPNIRHMNRDRSVRQYKLSSGLDYSLYRVRKEDI